MFQINKQENEELVLEDDDFEECKDNCTVYGYLSKTRNEEIKEELTEDDFVKILYSYSKDISPNVSFTVVIFLAFSFRSHKEYQIDRC